MFQSRDNSVRHARHWDRLQRDPRRDVEAQIIEQYRDIYDAFFADRAAIPAGQLHEVRFEDLERDPEGELRAIYRQLDLGWPEAWEPRLRRYLASIRGYRKNTHRELDPAVRRRVADAWHRNFEAWDYRP